MKNEINSLKTELNLSSLTQHIFRQFPHLFLVLDLNQNFIFSNDYTALLFGYKKEEDILGLNAHHMRCRAVECASLFIQQDQEVLSKRKVLNLLDIHEYADSQTKILLTKKTPFYDMSNNITGTVCSCVEINTKTLYQIGHQLASHDVKYKSKKSPEHSYQIGSALHPKMEFKKREIECLFYLIRGKTCKEIAQTLHLSQRTIEDYLEQLKDKFSCHKKSELIEKAIHQGYLNIIPETFLNKEVSILLE